MVEGNSSSDTDAALKGTTGGDIRPFVPDAIYSKNLNARLADSEEDDVVTVLNEVSSRHSNGSDTSLSTVVLGSVGVGTIHPPTPLLLDPEHHSNEMNSPFRGLVSTQVEILRDFYKDKEGTKGAFHKFVS